MYRISSVNINNNKLRVGVSGASRKYFNERKVTPTKYMVQPKCNSTATIELTRETLSRLHFFGRKKRSYLRFCACAINVKSSSEATKHFRYKCHELFVNSPVMITVKSVLKCLSK